MLFRKTRKKVADDFVEDVKTKLKDDTMPSVTQMVTLILPVLPFILVLVENGVGRNSNPVVYNNCTFINK